MATSRDQMCHTLDPRPPVPNPVTNATLRTGWPVPIRCAPGTDATRPARCHAPLLPLKSARLP
eukprot:1511804-Prymnesium_polylepis.1